jgi:DNA anti-recombination protein RmuC
VEAGAHLREAFGVDEHERALALAHLVRHHAQQRGPLVRLSKVNTRLTKVNTHLSRVYTHPSKVNTHLSKLNTHLSRVYTHPSKVNTRLSKVNTHLSKVNTHPSKVNTRLSKVNTRRSRVNTGVSPPAGASRGSSAARPAPRRPTPHAFSACGAEREPVEPMGALRTTSLCEKATSQRVRLWSGVLGFERTVV